MDEVNAIPAGIRTVRANGIVRIVRSWFTHLAWVFLAFSVFWNGMLLAWFGFALWDDSMPKEALILTLLHVAGGVWLIYATASMFLNKTTVEVSNGKIIVRHGPLPWWGNIDIESLNLTHVFCSESPRLNNRNSPATYRVNAVTRDGHKIRLVGGGLKKDQALYIAGEIRTQLGLSRAPVVGQVN